MQKIYLNKIYYEGSTAQKSNMQIITIFKYYMACSAAIFSGWLLVCFLVHSWLQQVKCMLTKEI